jgi:hypothetical protein
MNVLSHCTEESSSRYLETSVNVYQITGCQITEGTILQSYCHDTLRTQYGNITLTHNPCAQEALQTKIWFVILEVMDGELNMNDKIGL